MSVPPEQNSNSTLNGKAFTHLELSLSHLPQEQLVALLQSLEPNLLKEFKFHCDDMTLYPVALIDDLRIGAWAALEEIELEFWRVDMQLSDLFDSLPRLPKLRKCSIDFLDIKPVKQFVSALTSLFSSPIETKMVSAHGNLSSYITTGCTLTNDIRQVLKLHPMLEIEFEISIWPRLKISLGNVSFVDRPYLRPCSNANCMDCGSFYPLLLYKLESMAIAQVHACSGLWSLYRFKISKLFRMANALVGVVHLEVGSLYTCKIDKVVDDLNRFGDGLQLYEALSVGNNGNVATITFRSLPNEHQFNITVVCGRCISNRCTKCIHID